MPEEKWERAERKSDDEGDLSKVLAGPVAHPQQVLLESILLRKHEIQSERKEREDYHEGMVDCPSPFVAYKWRYHR